MNEDDCMSPTLEAISHCTPEIASISRHACYQSKVSAEFNYDGHQLGLLEPKA